MTKYIYPYRVSVIREHTDRYPKVDRSQAVNEIARKFLADAATERFLMFPLNSKNQIINFVEISVGCLNFSVVHPRDAFRAAVILGASAVIFAHNHPSGDTKPSKEDRKCTQRLAQAGDILGIRVLDSIIVGDDYYSFADAGLLTTSTGMFEI